VEVKDFSPVASFIEFWVRLKGVWNLECPNGKVSWCGLLKEMNMFEIEGAAILLGKKNPSSL